MTGFPPMGELAIGGIMVGLLLLGYVFFVYVVLRLARWLRAFWQARQAAGEVADVPEDTQPPTEERWGEDAILLTHEAVDLDDPMRGVDFAEFEQEFAGHRKVQRLAALLEERHVGDTS